MPSFTSEVPDLRGVGPVVEIQLSVAETAENTLQQASQPIPQPVRVTALIDTGASVSVIQQGLAQQLGLQPVGIVYVNTPSSENVHCYQYALRFIFPNRVIFQTTAIEARLQGQNIQCLLGRDLLSHGVFVYIGYKDLFSLSI